MTLSDQLVVMNNGVIEQVGDPAKVYGSPATRFVATFIGSPPMNILEGTVEGPDLVAVGGSLLPVAGMRRDLKTNTRVDVGIRPEDVRVLSDRDVALCMDVELVEELGGTQLFHGRVGGADFALQAATGQVRAEGRQLPLGIDPANVHLFDRSTGERLVASP